MRGFCCASAGPHDPNTGSMRTILGEFHSQVLALPAGQATHLIGSGAGRPSGARLSLAVKNVSAGTVYIGGATVTVAAGYPLDVGETFPADTTGGLYALSVAGGNVALLEGF